jgi:hypothetical protein
VGEVTGRCDSNCEHGGVCILAYGHDGLHDSRYCQWDDEHALSPEEADEVYLRDRNPLMAPFDSLIMLGREIEREIESRG